MGITTVGVAVAASTIVMLSGTEAANRLPLAATARAVMTWLPLPRAGKGKRQVPSGLMVTVPRSVLPSKMCRASPSRPVPARSPRLPAVNCAPGAGEVMVGTTTAGVGVAAVTGSTVMFSGCELASTLPPLSTTRANSVC